MSAYIGVVGPSMDYSPAWQSILRIRRRPGDDLPHFIHATKGYEARQNHINAFLASAHDELLLLDHDMVFEPDTLERLRAHDLPYVSGYYMRRQYKNVGPVWFEPGDEFPVMPFLREPATDRLHELGGSGWGCIYIRREVILATRALLEGEDEVLEDDMDLWPYDLEALMRTRREALRLLDRDDGGGLSEGAAAGNVPDREFADEAYGLLRSFTDLIRPLRGQKDIVGSDIRFPFFAKQAGYTLWGDPMVRPGHILHYPISPDDYSALPDETKEERREATWAEISRLRAEARERNESWT